MDGNRRWARRHGRPLIAGHRAGKDAFIRVVDAYEDLRERWGTRHYLFYAFSTENWRRSDMEIADLMGVFDEAFDALERELPRLVEGGVRVRFLGDRARFSPRLQGRMLAFEHATAGHHANSAASGNGGVVAQGTIALAVSYGGRADIAQAASALLRDGAPATEASLAEHLWTAGIPDPDLIIRPGGERRLSNFLTWQSAYSELAFSDTLWPDFSIEELEAAFADYAARERRHGA
jgi:undecaprenyl diphosphate synthase